MTDEEFVVAHWERADLCEAMLGAAFCISLGGRGFTRANVPGRDVDSAEKAWAAAAEFTRERLEQIRQLEVETRKVDHQRRLDLSRALNLSQAAEIYGRDAARWGRLLARLESALASLRSGMLA